MKKILYIAFVAAALAAVSCAKNAELNFNPSLSEQAVSLTFSCGNLATRADEDTSIDGENNENRVKRIDYFFFPYGSDGKVADATKPVYSGVYTPSTDYTGTETNKELVKKYTTILQPGVLGQIFPGYPNGATKAMVFAVANYNGTTALTADLTWKQMHELKIGATFFQDGGEGFGIRWPRPMATDNENLFFVMTAEQEIELRTTGGEYAVDALIPLKRLASKVTVEFTFEEEIVDDKGIIWRPLPKGDETRVYLSNAIEHTLLGGPLTGNLVPDSWDTCTEPTGDGTRDLFEYAYDFLKNYGTAEEGEGGESGEGEESGEESGFIAELPYYYTYPVNLEEGDDNQPFLKLVLPWYGYKVFGEGANAHEVLYKQKEVYYKIVLPRESVSEPNKIYQYKVHVNIIGSDMEVKLIGEEYKILDWTTKTPVSSNVATGRYISLDIPKLEYDMYVNFFDINFVSSGKVIANVDEIYQMDLGGSAPTPVYFMQDNEVVADQALMTKKGITAQQIKNWVTIPENTSILRINHTVNNNLMNGTSVNGAFDMSPYVFVVTLHLEDASDAYDRTVTITQYPSMYVTSVQSNGSVYVNGATFNPRNYSTDSQGIQATAVYNDSNNQIGSVASKATALITNKNNNGYNMIIHPTILDESLNLILGDSRVAQGGTLANINGLTQYNPTRTDVTNIVSPGFMIASSDGKTSPMSFDLAKERYASYQENGYPAGRWRLPTPGEIEFLVKLSNNGFIPSLFEGDYWAANQRYYTSTSGSWSTNGSGNHYTRCIYDTWFWGEEPYQADATTWLGFRD